MASEPPSLAGRGCPAGVLACSESLRQHSRPGRNVLSGASRLYPRRARIGLVGWAAKRRAKMNAVRMIGLAVLSSTLILMPGVPSARGALQIGAIHAAAQVGEPIGFVEWVDPTEKSFSVAVPRGWQVSGGTHWIGQTDARAFARVESPDGTLRVFVDDPDV